MTLVDRITMIADELRKLSHRVSLGGHELTRLISDLNDVAREISVSKAPKVSSDTIARASASANEAIKETTTRFSKDMAKKAAEVDIGDSSKFRTTSRFRED